MAAIMHGKLRASDAQVMGIALLFFFLILSSSSMAQFCEHAPGKKSWPELVGKYGRIAPLIIKFQNPNVQQVPVLLEGTAVTQDIRCDRVRVWIKPNGTIYEAPRLG